jgi:hypothetical protein
MGFLFSSSARTEILRVLVYQPDRIGIRQSARLAGVLPHSADLALKTLTAEKLVKRERLSARSLYRLNPDHPDCAVLRAVFAAATQESIRSGNRRLEQRAQTILPFVREAGRMLSQARRSRRVA